MGDSSNFKTVISEHVFRTLRWRHNRPIGVSNHQPHDCLLIHSYRRRSQKPSRLRVPGLCVGNSLVTREFPAQMTSNAENASILWRHHDQVHERFFCNGSHADWRHGTPMMVNIVLGNYLSYFWPTKSRYGVSRPKRINSLAPGRFEPNFRWVIFKLISVTDGWGISGKIALRWMPLDLTDDKSTLVQVMAWCRQATSHYLSQCWPRFMSPYGVTRPQWVKTNQLLNLVDHKV